MVGNVNFKLSTDQAGKLFKSTDGMQANKKSDWKEYPQRKDNAWGVGFTDSFEFTSGLGKKSDGALDFKESKLASHQLQWDTEKTAIDENDKKVNSDPISKDKSVNGQNFLNSVYDSDGKIYKGLDTDNDGKFTETDMKAVAKLDGNAGEISSADFEKAADAPEKSKYTVKTGDCMENVVGDYLKKNPFEAMFEDYQKSGLPFAPKDLKFKERSVTPEQIHEGTEAVLATGDRSYDNAAEIQPGEQFDLHAADGTLKDKPKK